MVYADHARSSDEAWVTLDRLVERSGLSRDAANRALRSLVEIGWLTVRRPARQHYAAVYALTIPARQESGNRTAERADNLPQRSGSRTADPLPSSTAPDTSSTAPDTSSTSAGRHLRTNSKTKGRGAGATPPAPSILLVHERRHRCAAHAALAHDDPGPPCLRCRDARLAAEQAAEVIRVAAEQERRDRRARERAEIANCPHCNADGWNFDDPTRNHAGADQPCATTARRTA